MLNLICHNLQQFHQLPQGSLSPDINAGSTFTSVCINTAIYLPWLVSQCLNNGVIFKRATFKHIADAASSSLFQGQKINLVINCTGLGASKLGDVLDTSVVPARGQIVVVSNVADKMIATSGTDDGADEACYVMTRAAGGGTVLGGCYQKGSWDSQVDRGLATRIMQRAVAICPSLTGGKGIEHLDVIRHGVGLRPVREGGARVELERISGVRVVHNYGAGGAGMRSRILTESRTTADHARLSKLLRMRAGCCRVGRGSARLFVQNLDMTGCEEFGN